MDNQANNPPTGGEKKDEKKLEAAVKNYVGPEGITTKQLEAGLWYVEHKKILRNILYGFLILVGAISWTYTIYGFAYYIARGMAEDQILAKQLVNTSVIGHDYVVAVGAKELTAGPVGILGSTDKKYDLYSQLKNDNADWWVEFDYYFITEGQATKKAHNFILPSESKYLFALAQDFFSPPASAALMLENVVWQRISAHQIPDWPDYYHRHLDIESSNIKFIPASLSPLSEKLNLNQLSFKVINQTAYNYWETGFIILLYRSGSLVNINHYILSDFLSGQERSIELSWPGSIGQADRVEIIPEINIMKEDIYIKYEGGVGQEK